MHGGPGTEARTEALRPPREALAAGGAPHNPREGARTTPAGPAGRQDTDDREPDQKGKDLYEYENLLNALKLPVFTFPATNYHGSSAQRDAQRRSE